MACLQCGNCQQNQLTYYCAEKNEFVIGEGNTVVKEKEKSSWKKGNPGYELHRRRTRKERDDVWKAM